MTRFQRSMMAVIDLLKKKKDIRTTTQAYRRMFNEIDYMLATITLRGTRSREYLNGAFECRAYIKKQVKQIMTALIEEEKGRSDG